MIASRLKTSSLWLCASTVVLALAAAGCWSSSGSEVIVYTALDAEYSRPIFRDFTAASGVEVLPKFDTESTKTVGLAEAIIAERQRPRCDVFWNNEILHTLRLEKLGLLEPYASVVGSEYPAMYRSPSGAWHGFAARARVLIVNTKLLSPDERPTSVRDFADAKWRGRAAIAKPLFGTTATHAACLFAAWGDDEARQFFDAVQQNVQILSGNRQVALAVASGQLAIGLTDTDDAIVELENGQPVAIVYPDQQPGGMGTLFIPNTVAIIRGCPHPAAARQLVDYLLSPKVEERLAAGPSAQIPLHPRARPQTRVETPATIRAMQVDFAAAGEKWPEVAKYLRDRFTAGR